MRLVRLEVATGLDAYVNPDHVLSVCPHWDGTTTVLLTPVIDGELYELSVSEGIHDVVSALEGRRGA